MLGQQALPRVGHRWVKRATIAAVILLALCLFLVGLDCLVAGPTSGCAVIVGQAAIVTSAFLVSVVVQMLGNSRVRQVSDVTEDDIVQARSIGLADSPLSIAARAMRSCQSTRAGSNRRSVS
jgi:hypothetical protein